MIWTLKTYISGMLMLQYLYLSLVRPRDHQAHDGTDRRMRYPRSEKPHQRAKGRVGKKPPQAEGDQVGDRHRAERCLIVVNDLLGQCHASPFLNQSGDKGEDERESEDDEKDGAVAGGLSCFEDEKSDGHQQQKPDTTDHCFGGVHHVRRQDEYRQDG